MAPYIIGASGLFCLEKFSGQLLSPLSVFKHTRTLFCCCSVATIFMTMRHVTTQSHSWFCLLLYMVYYMTLLFLECGRVQISPIFPPTKPLSRCSGG